MDLVNNAQNYLIDWYAYFFGGNPAPASETWEDHPIIRRFYQITEFENLTQAEKECIATAYTIHDRHFETTLQDLIKRHSITQEAVNDAKIKQVIKYLQDKVETEVRNGNGVLGGNFVTESLTLTMDNFTHNEWWTGAQELTKELKKHVDSGEIHNIETFYHYMCVEPGLQMNEVLGQGW